MTMISTFVDSYQPLIIAQVSAPVSQGTNLSAGPVGDFYGAVGVCVVKDKMTGEANPYAITRLWVSNSAWQLFPQKFPGFSAKGAVTKSLKESGEGPDFMSFDAGAGIVSVLQAPRKGALELDSESGDYKYIAKIGYLGKDQAIFLVKIQGFLIKVVYYINVVPEMHYEGAQSYERTKDKFCPEPRIWNISSASSYSFDIKSAERIVSLSALLASASASLTGLAQLSGAALGQTTGEGANAQITLDTTAAGRGWYIDPISAGRQRRPPPDR